ncbi:hypothetical protein MJM04_28780, partial [Salmonella enterica subsp. enterica serovar Cerro]|nr:hypothetical protein [Salmonella enterica subsp. enterica serovar Cerro]
KDDIRDEQRYHGYCDAMTRRGLAPLRINPRAISSIHLGIQLMCYRPVDVECGAPAANGGVFNFFSYRYRGLAHAGQ